MKFERRVFMLVVRASLFYVTPVFISFLKPFSQRILEKEIRKFPRGKAVQIFALSGGLFSRSVIVDTFNYIFSQIRREREYRLE